MSSKEKTTMNALHFWQVRSLKQLSEEDARETSETLFNFVQILLDWNREDALQQYEDLPTKKGAY
ncbi:MAG: hypothetical protein K8S15_10430 [Candidatus Aegiribacteria sp.]|nr:hypothetical protein [Candidatus Aegiribacteria sp.]